MTHTQRKTAPRDLPLGGLIFWGAYLALLVIHCIENTSLTYLDVPWLSVMYVIRNLLYLALLVKILLLTSYQVTELWIIAGVFLATGISFLITGDFTLLEFAIVTVAAKDASPRSVVQMLALTKALAIMLTFLLSVTGILPSLEYGNADGSVYDTMGFCHRNVLGANMAVLCLCWFFLRFRRLDWRDVLLWVVLSILTYFLAISRSSLIIMLLSIAVLYGLRLAQSKLSKIPHLWWIVMGLFLSMFLLSLICTLFYKQNSGLWLFLDKLFTRRIKFANQCYQLYGFSLFGQQMPFASTMGSAISGAKRLILDNTYMYLMIHTGVLSGFTLLFLYLKGLDLSLQKQDWPMIGCLLVLAVYGLSERYMLDVFYDFPLMLVCMSMMRRASKKGTVEPLPYARDLTVRIWARIKPEARK